MRSLLAVVVACLLSSAAGFRTAVSTPRFHGRRSAAAPPARATTATTRTTMMAEPPNNNENNNNNKPGLGAALSKLPLNSALSVFLIVTSARDLVREARRVLPLFSRFEGGAASVEDRVLWSYTLSLSLSLSLDRRTMSLGKTTTCRPAGVLAEGGVGA